MAKKKSEAIPAHNITLERAARLFQLVSLLGRGAQTRAGLIRALRLNVRGFYRDLESLRVSGVAVALVNGQYQLADRLAVAIECLPFPDPGLTLGEARQLSRGRTGAHRKFRAQIARIEK